MKLKKKVTPNTMTRATAFAKTKKKAKKLVTINQARPLTRQTRQKKTTNVKVAKASYKHEKLQSRRNRRTRRIPRLKNW